MKIKYLLSVLCIAMLTLLFAACTNEDDLGGGGQTPPCTHNYIEGICEHCGKIDTEYKSDDDGKGDGSGEQKPGEEPEVPPIEMGGSTELPFVPAK